jgi:hypothetical protein
MSSCKLIFASGICLRLHENRLPMEISENAASCVPLPFFFGANIVDGLHLKPDGSGAHEERTIVTTHTGMAPHDLKKKEKAHFIMPNSVVGTYIFLQPRRNMGSFSIRPCARRLLTFRLLLLSVQRLQEICRFLVL